MMMSDLDFSQDLVGKRYFLTGPTELAKTMYRPLASVAHLSNPAQGGANPLPKLRDIGVMANFGYSNPTRSSSPPMLTIPSSSPHVHCRGPVISPHAAAMLSASNIRRHRVSSRQKETLGKVFRQSFFPSTEVRAKLAAELGMTPRAVQIWFQNKRQAWRTKHKNQTTNSSSSSSSSPSSTIATPRVNEADASSTYSFQGFSGSYNTAAPCSR